MIMLQLVGYGVYLVQEAGTLGAACVVLLLLILIQPLTR